MFDGHLLIDAHLHPARLPTLKVDWDQWVRDFGDGKSRVERLFDEDGTLAPERFDAHLAAEGVDVALLFSEYSPRVTGIQPVEDIVPFVKYNPERFRLVANVNPHVHHPARTELERQLELGAVALKLHPVHGGFPVNDRELYPAYDACRELALPVIVHSGTSTFPGATNRYADPLLLDDVLRDFPGLTVVLAHGGRGWWYDAAAFLALANDDVWVELSGLPPKKLPTYFRTANFHRLARKCIFGSDWPDVPGIAHNARALADLGLDEETLGLVLGGNARRVYLGRE